MRSLEQVDLDCTSMSQDLLYHVEGKDKKQKQCLLKWILVSVPALARLDRCCFEGCIWATIVQVCPNSGRNDRLALLFSLTRDQIASEYLSHDVTNHEAGLVTDRFNQ
jgi:hypothetical protein